MTTNKFAGAALVAAAGVAGVAHADIVHFVNPAPGQAGHYDWRAAPPGSANIWLDITRPPDQQPDVQSGNAVGQIREEWFDSYLVYHTAVGAGPVAQVAGYAWDFVNVADGLPHGAAYPRANSHFASGAYFYEVEGPDSFGGPYFLPGERRYIGVRTEGGNYGWVEVELNYPNFAAFSWAYETVPGAPIYAGQIPSPGAAVGLGVGAFAVTGPKRRRPAGRAVAH